MIVNQSIQDIRLKSNKMTMGLTMNISCSSNCLNYKNYEVSILFVINKTIPLTFLKTK